MRLRCLVALLLAALALAACARPAPRYAVASRAQFQQPGAELDARMYGAPQPGARAARQPNYASASPDRNPQPRAGLDARIYGAPQPASRAAQRAPQAMAAYASQWFADAPYTLDAGDKLRVVVFGQDALSNSYAVDAQGRVTLPLIGAVNARGLTTSQLSASIRSRLAQGFIRDPSVAVEVEVYRPFFVLGEVTYPGQYPYVPDMTVEKAIAIAGGFTPRAKTDRVIVKRQVEGGTARFALPLHYPLRPGDTVTVGERWF
jgi:polysaccharide export outer membrane protein